MDGIEILFPAQDIAARVAALGERLSTDYAGRRPVLVTVLKGSSIFLADLVRAIDTPVTIDLMAITSFASANAGGGEKGGRARIIKDLDTDVDQRDVVLVEDIIDTGLTGAYLLNTLRTRGAASVEICTLLDKSVRRIAPIDVRYAGFDCPDRFMIGYGLDHQERFRTLHSIYTVDDPGALDEGEVLALDRGLSVRAPVATVEP